MRRKSFRAQSGRKGSAMSQPKGVVKKQPATKAAGAGMEVACVCGEGFVCIGYYEEDVAGQLWRNCTCCERHFKQVGLTAG